MSEVVLNARGIHSLRNTYLNFQKMNKKCYFSDQKRLKFMRNIIIIKEV